MGCIRAEYGDIRSQMNPGDVMAFGGNCFMSDVFKMITRSCVSHSGVILQSKMVIEGTPQNGFFNQIIESTEFNGFLGVQINRLSTVISAYDGDVWWLPLAPRIREKLNLQKFYDFLIHQEGKPFDIADSVELMVETFVFHHANVKEDFHKFFCSELVVAGLEAGGALPEIDASDVTPADLCKLNIFQDDYYQLKGKDKEIKRFNSIDPQVYASSC